MRAYSIECIEADQVIPPFGDFGETELLERILQAGVDTVVFARLQDSDVKTTVQGTQYGVYTANFPSALFEFEFYNLQERKTFLRTQIETRGNEFASWNTIVSFAAVRAVREFTNTYGIERRTTPERSD
jgi:hypothetical protein